MARNRVGQPDWTRSPDRSPAACREASPSSDSGGISTSVSGANLMASEIPIGSAPATPPDHAFGHDRNMGHDPTGLKLPRHRSTRTGGTRFPGWGGSTPDRGQVSRRMRMPVILKPAADNLRQGFELLAAVLEGGSDRGIRPGAGQC